MTDRLSLTNALADANIDREHAEHIATIIVRMIRRSYAAASDLDAREKRVAAAFARVPMISEQQAKRIAAIIAELVRQRHPGSAHHG